MPNPSHHIPSDPIKTDDLAFSAFLRLQGHELITIDKNRGKRFFIFNISENDAEQAKVSFINSDFLKFYNEIRNLKKMMD